jgi:hypothetical protein
VQQPFEDLAKISSYSNAVTSVWHVQMGSKVDQKLSNGIEFKAAMLLQGPNVNLGINKNKFWATTSSRGVGQCEPGSLK